MKLVINFMDIIPKVSGKNNRALVLTLEGGGDESSATISEFNSFMHKELYKTNNAMFGRIV